MTISTPQDLAHGSYHPGNIASPEECATCGAAVTSRFCPECGEKRASDRRYSLRAFAHEHLLEALASFDGRLLRTVRVLVKRPGELTAAFMRGARVPYLPPIQCFLIFNVALFFWSSAARVPILDTPLSAHLRGTPYSALATRLVNERIARTHEPIGEFSARFDTASAAQARSFVAVMVPALALLVGLVAFRQRRPFVQHLVFSLHAFSFLFLMAPIVITGIGSPITAILRAMHVTGATHGYSAELSMVVIATLACYLAVSLRRAYDLRRPAAIVGAIVLALGIGQILQGYREFLFFVTLWTL